MKVFTADVTATASMTCYVQDRSDELASARVRPLVLVLPGGGYQFCSDREAEPIALAYLAEGFNACVLRYAVGPDAPWSISFADGEAGLDWVRAHADELDGDPAKVAVVGFSAGGHLAAALAVAAASRPDAAVLGYPVTLEEFGAPVGKEILDIPSNVSEATPPTFVFATCGDSLVPIRNSVALLAALAEHGVPFESHIYLLGPHGISLAKPLTANGNAALVDATAAQWLGDSVRFLQRVFGDFAVAGSAESIETLRGRRLFGLDMPIGRLLADERAAAAIERHVPGAVASLAGSPMVAGMSLREVSTFRPELFGEGLAQLEVDLVALN